ncbi:MAG: Hsp20/alpha crystallin family protein [bacterium]|nr:Hsp20/alpha crystallin family protein [bacterium]
MNLFKKLSGLNSAEVSVEDKSDENSQQNIPESTKTENWLEDDYEEGQLSIDVYQTEKAIIIKSTIAGVKPDDIDISINSDMLTIRGKRETSEEISEDDYFYQECYWGSFSRSIILPCDVRADKIDATIENGILTITLPKTKSEKKITVKIKD